jgi:lipid A 3-O-deacylase
MAADFRYVSFTLCILFGAGIYSPCRAAPEPDAVAVFYGPGMWLSYINDRYDAGVAYDYGWTSEWPIRDGWLINGYTEFGASTWTAHIGTQRLNLTDAGVTPAIRFTHGGAAEDVWHYDLGFGGHLMSRTSLGPQVFSTAFQFGEFAGVGVLLGDGGRYDVGLKLIHQSNGNLKKPNDGMDFLVLRMAVRF